MIVWWWKFTKDTEDIRGIVRKLQLPGKHAQVSCYICKCTWQSTKGPYAWIWFTCRRNCCTLWGSEIFLMFTADFIYSCVHITALSVPAIKRRSVTNPFLPLSFWKLLEIINISPPDCRLQPVSSTNNHWSGLISRYLESRRSLYHQHQCQFSFLACLSCITSFS